MDRYNDHSNQQVIVCESNGTGTHCPADTRLMWISRPTAYLRQPVSTTEDMIDRNLEFDNGCSRLNLLAIHLAGIWPELLRNNGCLLKSRGYIPALIIRSLFMMRQRKKKKRMIGKSSYSIRLSYTSVTELDPRFGRMALSDLPMADEFVSNQSHRGTSRMILSTRSQTIRDLNPWTPRASSLSANHHAPAVMVIKGDRQ